MSSSDRLLLILHIGFAIFTLGPLTAATMASPRSIRRREVSVLRYLNRMTRIYGLLALGIFLFGLLLADGRFARVWLSASMTLFVVALVLLVIVERDQRRAVHALELAGGAAPPAEVRPPAAPEKREKAGKEAGEPAAAATAGPEAVEARPAAGETAEGAPVPGRAGAAGQTANTGAVAQVEQGRIAALSGVVALIWLVILVLMVWYA